MTTPTPLPLDAAALDRWSALLARIIDHSDGTRQFAEVYDDELEPFIAQARAALTLAARVAELEAANVAATMAYADVRVQAGENAATANALRDALEKIAERVHTDGCDMPDLRAQNEFVYRTADKALAAHPAAALAAHDAEVLAGPGFKLACQVAGAVWAMCAPDEPVDSAACIAIVERALAAQAQEVKP